MRLFRGASAFIFTVTLLSLHAAVQNSSGHGGALSLRALYDQFVKTGIRHLWSASPGIKETTPANIPLHPIHPPGPQCAQCDPAQRVPPLLLVPGFPPLHLYSYLDIHTTPRLPDAVALAKAVIDIVYIAPVEFVRDATAYFAHAASDLVRALWHALIKASRTAMYSVSAKVYEEYIHTRDAVRRAAHRLQSAHAWLVREDEHHRRRWAVSEADLVRIAQKKEKYKGQKGEDSGDRYTHQIDFVLEMDEESWRGGNTRADAERAAERRAAWNAMLQTWTTRLLDGVEACIVRLGGLLPIRVRLPWASAAKRWVHAVLTRTIIFVHDHMPLLRLVLPTLMEIYCPYSLPRLILALVDFFCATYAMSMVRPWYSTLLRHWGLAIAYRDLYLPHMLQLRLRTLVKLTLIPGSLYILGLLLT